MRALSSATIESFNCPGGELKYPEDALKPGQARDDKRRPASRRRRRSTTARSSRSCAGAWRRCTTHPQGFEGNPPAQTGPGPERLRRRDNLRDAVPVRARPTGGWGSATSRCTWPSSSSRRSSSASARSGLFALYTDRRAAEFWTIAAFAEVCVAAQHWLHACGRRAARAADRRVDGGPGRRARGLARRGRGAARADAQGRLAAVPPDRRAGGDLRDVEVDLAAVQRAHHLRRRRGGGRPTRRSSTSSPPSSSCGRWSRTSSTAARRLHRRRRSACRCAGSCSGALPLINVITGVVVSGLSTDGDALAAATSGSTWSSRWSWRSRSRSS